jgi:hypothetical protein
VLFEMMRGNYIPRYPIACRDTGVVVLPNICQDEEIKAASDLVQSQYFATIDSKASDIELFALMSFAYLGIDATDASPPPDNAVVHERYLISHNEHYAIAFCLHLDGSTDLRLEAIASRLLEHERHRQGSCSALCIINHESRTAVGLRKVEEAISDEVTKIASQNGITLITAPDLLSLVRGIIEYQWDTEPIRNLLFAAGRQGAISPVYREIGTYVRFYPRHAVMSVDLHRGETVNIGDTLGMRLATRYHEETIESLQVNRNAVVVATGPCRVGIKTSLHKSDIDIGQDVFLRRR